ncbi:hypothetical protein EBB07_01835 [Paenibacillaceae bacterium]|nr:hypothetical protein EBB07_01835 [Paenibacillaceae bacterium]
MKYTVQKHTAQKQSRHSKPSGKNMLLALLMLLAVAGWAIVSQVPSQSDSGQRAHLTAEKDLGKLWRWADETVAGGASGAEWSVRWDGEGKLSSIEALAAALHIEQPSGNGTGAGTEEGHRIMKERGGGSVISFGNEHEGKLQLWHSGRSNVMQAFDLPQTFVLLYEGAPGETYRTISGQLRTVDSKLLEQGLSMRTSFSFRGDADGNEAEQKLTKLADGKLQESYEDGLTISRTYYSAHLNTATDSGGRKVNLQLAQFPDGTSGRMRLVAGVPLITGDYVAGANK